MRREGQGVAPRAGSGPVSLGFYALRVYMEQAGATQSNMVGGWGGGWEQWSLARRLPLNPMGCPHGCCSICLG